MKKDRAGKGGFTHETPVGKSDEWWTPGWLFETLAAAGSEGGSQMLFDLDPCGHPLAPAAGYCGNIYQTAVRGHVGSAYGIHSDGLALPWYGRVFLNPPYSDTASWVDKLLGPHEHHTTAVTLTFSRTGAKWAQKLLDRADVVLFLNERVKFIPGDGQRASSPGADSMLCAFGQREKQALVHMAAAGFGVCR